MKQYNIDNGTLTQEIKDKYAELLQNESINARVHDIRYGYDDEKLNARIFVYNYDFIVMIYNDDTMELLEIHIYDKFDNLAKEWGR